MAKQDVKAANLKELLADYGAEVMALVQRNETDKLAQLTSSAYKEAMSLTISCGGRECPECKGKKYIWYGVNMVFLGHRRRRYPCPRCKGTGLLPTNREVEYQHQRDLLATSLLNVLRKVGMLNNDTEPNGPELIMFSEQFCQLPSKEEEINATRS